MATSTPYLGLTLMSIGENVGTWGLPLNNNFAKVDALAGEIISARGAFPTLAGRFVATETEVTAARGTFGSLNSRLSYLINADGSSNIGNYTKASGSGVGVLRLSTAPANAGDPIAVGDNDTRVLSQVQKDGLVLGGITTLHKHNLLSIADITATFTEVNRALTGTSGNVTAGNLNILTGGGVVPKTLMTVPNAAFNFTGIASLSVAPANMAAPIAVGDNDPRVLTQIQKDGLTTLNVTSLHKHNLVDGAADLTVAAAVLNRLTGAGVNVNASNLDNLTSGLNSTLHNHDTRYFTKTESDAQHATLVDNYTAALASHNTDDQAHANANLILGNVTAKSVTSAAAGIAADIRTHTSEPSNAVKVAVKDKAGVAKFTVTGDGIVTCDKIIARISEVVETTTLTQEAILTSDLTVKGNTVLGDSTTTDTLTVNTSVSTFNGDVVVSGPNGIQATSFNGVDVEAEKVKTAALQTEVLAARGGAASLVVRIGDAVGAVQTELTAFKGLKNNPQLVTITQAIAADGGTNITVAELEKLTDSSNADSLHTHTKYDDAINAAKISTNYGTFTTVAGRLEATETILNALNTEIVNARNGNVSVDARVDAVDTVITAEKAKVVALRTDLDAAVVDIGAVTTLVNTNHTAVTGAATTLTGRVTAVETDISTLTANDAAKTTQITNANTAISTLNGNVSGLTGSVNTVTTNLADRTGRIVTLEADNTSSKTRLTNLETFQGQTNTTLGLHAGRITTNETAILGRTKPAGQAGTTLARKEVSADITLASGVFIYTVDTTFQDIYVNRPTVLDITTGKHLLDTVDVEYVKVADVTGVIKIELKVKSTSPFFIAGNKLKLITIG